MNTDSRPSLVTILNRAFFSLITMILLVTVSLLLFASARLQQRAILNTQLFIAQDFSDEIADFFTEKFQLLESTTQIVDLAKGNEDQRKLILESILVSQPSFRQIVLLDKEGVELAQFSQVSLTLTEQFSTLLQSEVLSKTANGQGYVGSIYIDNVTSEPMVVMALPINVWDFQGILAAEVALEFMWNLVAELKVGDSGYVYVVNETGNLIAYSDTSRVLRGENLQHISQVESFLQGSTQSDEFSPEAVTYTGLLDTIVVGTYVPLDSPEWAVFIETPWREAYRDIITQGIWSIAIILVMALLAGATGSIVARRLSVSLVNLTEIADRISKGNLDLEASTSGPSEINRLGVAFNTMTSQLRDLIESLENRVVERTSKLEESSIQSRKRTEQLKTIAAAARTIAALEDTDELLPNIAELVSERFGFYHVGIFMLDQEKEFAVLHAANSAGGKQMIARSHKLRIGKEGVVGYSIAEKQARIALDVGEDAVFFDNPELPNTHSEMALPLKIGNNVIGVLDIQSEEVGAFSEDDVEVLSILADQVVVAIENARLFTQSKETLEELERTFQQYVRSEWKRFIEVNNVKGYVAHQADLQPIESSLQKDDKASKGDTAYRVPVKLRDVVIGHVNVDLDKPTEDYTTDELDIIHSAVERFTLALENARLLETTTRRARRERLVSEVTTKIRNTNDPDVMVKTAMEELKKILGASKVELQAAEPKKVSGGSS